MSKWCWGNGADQLAHSRVATNLLLFDFPGLRQWSVCLQCKRPGFSAWVGKIPWRRKWQPTPVFLPGKSHGRRNLVGYSPWGRKESDTTEQLHFLYFTCKCIYIYIYLWSAVSWGLSVICMFLRAKLQNEAWYFPVEQENILVKTHTQTYTLNKNKNPLQSIFLEELAPTANHGKVSFTLWDL